MARSTVHYADSSKNFEAKYRTLCKAAPADLDRLLSQLDPRHTLELDIARQFLSGLSAADLKKHPHLRTLSEIIQNLEQTEQISLRALLDQVVRPVKLDPGNSYKLVTVRLYGNGVHLRGAMLGDDIKGSNWFRVQTGDLIMSKIDARNGAFGIIPSFLDGAIVTNEFPLFRFKTARFTPEMLLTILTSPPFSCASIRHLSFYGPLGEQKRIVRTH